MRMLHRDGHDVGRYVEERSKVEKANQKSEVGFELARHEGGMVQVYS
jgi:hypothetical protein